MKLRVLPTVIRCHYRCRWVNALHMSTIDLLVSYPSTDFGSDNVLDGSVSFRNELS